jgi:hypothetical protein
MVYLYMGWTVEFVDDGVEAILTAMPVDIQAAMSFPRRHRRRRAVR